MNFGPSDPEISNSADTESRCLTLPLPPVGIKALGLATSGAESEGRGIVTAVIVTVVQSSHRPLCCEHEGHNDHHHGHPGSLLVVVFVVVVISHGVVAIAVAVGILAASNYNYNDCCSTSTSTSTCTTTRRRMLMRIQDAAIVHTDVDEHGDTRTDDTGDGIMTPYEMMLLAHRDRLLLLPGPGRGRS